MSVKNSIEISTFRSDEEIAQRVKEVNDYDRFAALTFSIRDERHAEEVVAADDVLITSKDGSVYTGHVEDWNDSHYFVNLD